MAADRRERLTAQRVKVDIYSDIACPWCYIGKARFERALGSFADGQRVTVRYRPYQLDPEAPSRAEPMLDYLARRFRGSPRVMVERVIGTARSEGLTMDYDRGLAVNTLDAHRLVNLAERGYGEHVQRALVGRLFAAHFAEGRDVGDLDTLSDLAGEVGMDADAARDYLRSDAGAREVRGEIDAARGLGINAVPTYLLDDKYALEGAQPTSVFLRALEIVTKEARVG
jgi:predicted DsbA family dithiol-disulfide isomerase